MKPKTILVNFGGGDQEMAALETAVEYAVRLNAWLEVWYVSPDPLSILLPFAPHMPLHPEKIVAGFEKEIEEQQKYAFERYLGALKGKPLKHFDKPHDGPSASFHAATGTVSDIIGQNGRVADLVVMTRPLDNVEANASIIGDVLFSSGKPVLVVPAGGQATPFNGMALIAWNARPEAARATALALPFLDDKVWVLSEPEGRNKEFTPSSEILASRLRRMGIKAEAVTPGIGDSSTAVSILNAAHFLGAGMIVMGAYSHGRFREVVFGGVTDYMLKHADVPLLMIH